MNKEDSTIETNFRQVKGLFSTLQKCGLITDEELATLLHTAVEKYHPIIGELEVNSIAGEKVARVEFQRKPTEQILAEQKKWVAAYIRVLTAKNAQENSLQSKREYYARIHQETSRLVVCRSVNTEPVIVQPYDSGFTRWQN